MESIGDFVFNSSTVVNDDRLQTYLIAGLAMTTVCVAVFTQNKVRDIFCTY